MSPQYMVFFVLTEEKESATIIIQRLYLTEDMDRNKYVFYIRMGAFLPCFR